MTFTMNKMPFDLNLLVVFDALIRERSVTRAGRRVGLSQPAMSHALNRLRYMLKDRLFVRTAGGMVPTPRADKLAQPLRKALSEIRLGMEPEEFEPSVSDRHFTLAVNNYSAIVLSPPLIAAVSVAAPKVRLDIRPSGTSDILGGLERSDFDLALGSAGGPSDRFRSTPLLEDRWVLVMRRGHPASRRRLSAKAFAALSHIEISSSYEDTSFIDAWLGERRLARRIALRVPNLAAPTVLVQSDLVATMRRRIALEMVRNNPLTVRELPCASPAIRTLMLWHLRLDSQPAHRWLRDVILSLTKRLRDP
jgi:DNA-binding transcriptional LysR family regulator